MPFFNGDASVIMGAQKQTASFVYPGNDWPPQIDDK
jgi:hypothetical protein